MSAGNSLLNALHLLDRAHVGEGSVVADFGCGSHGHIVLPAARAVGHNGRVYAVDLLPSALTMLKNLSAHHGHHNTHHIWGNFEKRGGVGIQNHVVDTVFFINNLSQANLEQALGEIKRVLKPAGSLVLVDWHKHIDHPIAPQKTHRMSDVEAYEILKQNGLISADRIDPSTVHWGLQCRFDE